MSLQVNITLKWTVLFLVCMAFILGGIKRGIPKFNRPTSLKLRLDAKISGNYSVLVRGADTSIEEAAEGNCIVINIPRLPRGDCWDFYFLTIIDGSPENLKSIFVLRDGKTVKAFSLRQLQQLPVDKDGFSLLKL